MCGAHSSTEEDLLEPIDNDTWERLTPRVSIPETDVQELITRVLPGALIRSVEAMPSGLANTNLRCDLAGHGPVLLRIHQRDPATAVRERALLAKVSGVVPVVPVLGYGNDGPRGLPWTLQEFVQGPLLARLLEDEDPAICAAAGQACGRVLAALAQIRFPKSGLFDDHLDIAEPFSPDEPFGSQFFRELLGDPALLEVLGGSRSEKLRFFVAGAGQEIPPADRTLCHGDFKGSNIVMRPDGSEVVALLDWEFAFAGTRLFDLAALSRWAHVLPPVFLPGVEAGTAAAGAPLPEGWQETARRIDVINLLSMLPGAPQDSRRRTDLLLLLDRVLGLH